jgi:hypothetical protein
MQLLIIDVERMLMFFFCLKFSVSANIYRNFAVGAVCGLAARGNGNE